MRRFWTAVCCLLLAGCSAPAGIQGEAVPPPPEETAPEEYAAALTIPLTDLEPYEPLVSMEPDVVGADTMGEVLCDETLPGGTRVVCYWHPEHLTDPDYRYEKYWAIRQGDRLLRFAAETSGYEYGYGATAFSDVLGQSGFRIEGPRGAAYSACDYYVFDGAGVPRLLVDCTNEVVERDVDGDGVTELVWDYHGGQTVTCAFLRDGAVCCVELMSLLAERLPIPALLWGELGDWEEAALPVTLLAGGWAVVDRPELQTRIAGRLRFTEREAVLEIPANQLPLEAWAGKRYTLMNGAPACQDIVYPEPDVPPAWTVLGPAVAAPREWAGQDLAGRNRLETWADVEPSCLLMQMVSVLDGWMVVSVSHGAGANADNYVYRTRDGGHTWQEAAKLEEAGRYPCAAGFFDDRHAVVGIEQYDGAPVFVTCDGGESWRRTAFSPLEEPDSWQADAISCWGDKIYINLCRGDGDGLEYRQLVSRDWGETWEWDT